MVSRYYKSAKNNYPLGQYHLGHCYDIGIGTETNIDQAIIWYQKASDNGISKQI